MKRLFGKNLLLSANLFLLNFVFFSLLTARAGSVNVNALVPGVCGNDIQEVNEECDGIDLDGNTCVGLGFASGDLSCNGNCTLNTSACISGGNIVVGGGGGVVINIPLVTPGTESEKEKKEKEIVQEKILKLTDLNKDKKVNLVDLSIILYHFNKPVSTVSLNYDLNNDGAINIVDVSILLYYWSA